MNPITALSEQFQKLINEHGSASILRDHLALLKEMLGKVETECSGLHNKIRKLEKDKIELRKKLDSYIVDEGFKKYRGVLFEKNPSGGYFETVYCASCKSPMTSMESFFPFLCSCGKSSGFKQHELASIIKELENE